MATITLNDVAKKAGVSKKTVSRVLNNEPTVAEITFGRVRQAMQELDYVPNTSARRLSSGKAMTIGVTVGWHIHDAYAGSVVESTFRECHNYGYNLSLLSIEVDDVVRILDAFRGKQVDGFILDTPSSMMTSLWKGLEQVHAPYVVINPNFLEKPACASYVCINDEKAMQECTEYLIKLGHRHIGYVSHNPAYIHQANRIRGYKKALTKAGIPVKNELISVEPNIVGSVIGVEAGLSLIKNFPELTAIIGATDAVALGILRAASMRGLKVPEDLSVTGFDDVYFISRVTPPLTTVLQPIEDMSIKAVQLLIERINHPSTAPEIVVLPTQLIIRESCKPPRQ
jgi:LacI family transcriptional regulator